MDTMTSMEAPATSIVALATALAAAQKNFAAIPKDREVTVTTKTRGSYKFKYATLDAILAATLPALNDQGLSLSQGLTRWDNHYAIKTTLYHKSGESISNVTPIFLSSRRMEDGRELPPGNQELGSGQSYARRYGVSALLCITADEDDDANHADGNHAEGQRIPFKPGAPGTASGGTQFRPAKRQYTGKSWTDDEAHLVDNGREKGTLPAKPANGDNGNAVRRIAWCRDAADLLKSANTKDELSQWWEANADRLAVIETALPQEHEKLIVAFDDAMSRVGARV